MRWRPDGREHLLRHELAEQDGVPAQVHPHQGPAATADVEQGHGHDVDRRGVEAPGGSHARHEDAEVGVGEHRPLGQPRRPGGVELHGHVALRHRDHRIDVRMTGHPGLIALVPWMLAEDDDRANAREGGLDLSEVREEVRAHEEHPRLGVVDDVGHLARGEAPVDGHVDGVEHPAAEEDFEVLGSVALHEGHAILRANAFAAQGLGHATGARAHLAPGDDA